MNFKDVLQKIKQNKTKQTQPTNQPTQPNYSLQTFHFANM